ncbi:MAG: hypothetical protein JSW07_12085 [bacterium]|nr:MAG: hypothetical protein JSW07_12085 [bacterium]
MQRKIYSFIFMVIIILFVKLLLAQVFIKKTGPGEGDIFFLNELSAILADKDGTITVEQAMPSDQRPQGFRDLDLKQNDEILMINKQRVKLVKELENIYNELEVGETIKLGIRRGEEIFLVSFNKIDPEKLPKRKFMIRKAVPDEGKTGDENKFSSYQIKIDNPDGKLKFLLGAGLIVKEKDNEVKIDKIIPEMTKNLGDVDVKEGDVIVALNGEKIKSLDQFSEIYDKIKVADEVHLVIKREQKEINVTFKKLESKGQVFIKEK